MGVRFHRRIYSPFSPLDPSLSPLKYSVTYIIIIVTMTGLLITTSHCDFGPVSTFRWKSDDVHDSARSWAPMKMCILAVLDDTDALRHMNKNNSERPVCITHPLTLVSTSFLFVFDTE